MLTPVALESVLAKAADAALVVSESGAILFANSLACTLFKYSAGELAGQTLELLIPHRNRMAHVGHRLRFTDDRRSRPMGSGLELFALCKDGSEQRVDISLIPMQRGLEYLVIATIRLRAPASAASCAN
jgi:PAS domain S-box-containing protein